MIPPRWCPHCKEDERYCTCHRFTREDGLEREDALDTSCPWCKLPLIECACEEPEPEPVRCVECGAPLFECQCDEKILEEES